MAAGDIRTYTQAELDRQIALGQASLIGIKTVSSNYQFVLSDAGYQVEFNSASNGTFTIPNNATVAFKVGAIISIFNLGTGSLTIAGGSGVTLMSPTGYRLTSQYATAALIQRAANVWVVSGYTAV